jgi:hypothetical protein
LPRQPQREVAAQASPHDRGDPRLDQTGLTEPRAQRGDEPENELLQKRKQGDDFRAKSRLSQKGEVRRYGRWGPRPDLGVIDRVRIARAGQVHRDHRESARPSVRQPHQLRNQGVGLFQARVGSGDEQNDPVVLGQRRLFDRRQLPLRQGDGRRDRLVRRGDGVPGLHEHLAQSTGDREEQIVLRVRRCGHVDRPMREIIFAGGGDPPKVAATCLSPQEPGNLVGAVQHLRCRCADQFRRDPGGSRHRELGHRRSPDGSILREPEGEVGISTATSDRQVGQRHAHARGGEAQALPNLGDHRVGQDRYPVPAHRRVTQPLDQPLFVAHNQGRGRSKVTRGRFVPGGRLLDLSNFHQRLGLGVSCTP